MSYLLKKLTQSMSMKSEGECDETSLAERHEANARCTGFVQQDETRGNLSMNVVNDSNCSGGSRSSRTTMSPQSNEFSSSSEGLCSAVERMSLDGLADCQNSTVEGLGGTTSQSDEVVVCSAAAAAAIKFDDAIVERHKRLGDAACEELVRLATGSAEAGWKVWESKGDMKIEKLERAGLVSVVGRGVYKWTYHSLCYDLDRIEDYLWDLNSKMEYDDYALEMLLLKEYSENYHIVYQAFKGRFGVAGRDFILVVHKERVQLSGHCQRLVIGAVSLPDQDSELIVNSVPNRETLERYHSRSKTETRAVASCAGFVVDWYPDTHTFILTYVNEVDLKTTGIPQWMVTRTKLDQLRIVKNIKTILDKCNQ